MTRPYDPFAPAAPTMPRERLLRAGVDEATVDSIAEQYENLSYGEKIELLRYVNAHPDEAIRERFSAPVTRESLGDLTVEELEDRIRAWNADHDDEQHLALSGRKADLVDRLADAYGLDEQQTATGLPTDGTEQPTGGTQPAEEPEPGAEAVATGTTTDAPAPADATVPTAPTPTATDGSPNPTDAAGAGDTTSTRSR